MLRRRYHIPRVDLVGGCHDLEMQMRAGGTSGRTDSADHISLPNTLAASHIQSAQVRIHRMEAASMIYEDHIAITVIIPAGIYDHARIGRIHAFSFIPCDVNAPVIGIRSVIE